MHWRGLRRLRLDLDAACASDLAVVNAARVSFNQESDVLGEREVGLINYLMKNHHGTPFEHGYFRFRVECPIFVAREWMRHRVGHSYNEWSGRYSELEMNFFKPEAFRRQTGKPGAYKFEPYPEVKDAATNIMEEAYSAAKEAYKELLAIGVAKEQARAVLPVSTVTKFIWSCNPRSLMHFLSLRTSPQAMTEIRTLATWAEEYLKDLMPATHAAWNAAGKIAP